MMHANDAKRKSDKFNRDNTNFAQNCWTDELIKRIDDAVNDGAYDVSVNNPDHETWLKPFYDNGYFINRFRWHVMISW